MGSNLAYDLIVLALPAVGMFGKDMVSDYITSILLAIPYSDGLCCFFLTLLEHLTGDVVDARRLASLHTVFSSLDLFP